MLASNAQHEASIRSAPIQPIPQITLRSNVDFPLTSKEVVIGPDAHPFYREVVAELGEAAAPKWNFHKYLIGKDGEIVGTFGSRTVPDAPEVVAAIEDRSRRHRSASSMRVETACHPSARVKPTFNVT
jgi:glutathione peroxidase-family protein